MTPKNQPTSVKSGSTTKQNVQDQGTVLISSTNLNDQPSTYNKPEAITIKPGTILNNRFDILEVIGSGGMGTVYKALDKRDIEVGNSYFIAIKVLNNECKNSPPLLKALYEETKKTQSLSHPNIVQVYDFDRDSNIVYMTMEWIEGAPLNQIIKRNPLGIKQAEAIDIINQIGKALSYAHSKYIIHLDLKPSNIYFDRNKDIKILDFGIAQKLNSSLADNDEPNIPMAYTPSYASIEILNGSTPSISDDIYAFACICYEVLTGQHPYNTERSDIAFKKQMVPKKIKSLNNQQWRALSRALNLQKKNRTESIEKFLVEFNAKKSKLKYIFLGGITALLLTFFYYQFQVDSKDNKHYKEKSDTPPVKNILAKEQGKIEVTTDKEEYKIGNTLTINFVADRALYTKIYIVNSVGEVTDLFPNPYQTNNLLKPELIYKIPPKNAEFTLDISGPKGKDSIIAFASAKPFPTDTPVIDKDGKTIKNELTESYIQFQTTYLIK